MAGAYTSTYEIIDLIGRGGMAEVFRGKAMGEAGFVRLVAIKRVLPHLSQNERFAEMFINEAKIASQLNHPNIVSVMNFARDGSGQLFLVMELVEGVDLHALMNSGPIPIQVAAFVAGEILRALAYAQKKRLDAQRRGIVHRDISPPNVLVSWDGAVKVSDFGLAKAAVATEETPTVSIKGKIGYMSPEQINAGPVDGRSDLFALGVVFHELLSGQPLFSGNTDADVISQMLTGEIGPPSRINRDVPPALDRICAKLLARDRERRYSAADLALADLAATGTIDPLGELAMQRLLQERFPDRGGGTSGMFQPVSSKLPDSERTIVLERMSPPSTAPGLTAGSPPVVPARQAPAPAPATPPRAQAPRKTSARESDKSIWIAGGAAFLAAATAVALYFSGDKPQSRAAPLPPPQPMVVTPVSPATPVGEVAPAPPDPADEVIIGSLGASGGIDVQSAAETLSAARPRIGKCLDSTGNAERPLQLELRVRPNGRVLEVSASPEDEESRAFVGCLGADLEFRPFSASAPGSLSVRVGLSR